MAELGQAESYPIRIHEDATDTVRQNESELIIRSGGQMWRVPWPSSETAVKESESWTTDQQPQQNPVDAPQAVVTKVHHWRESFRTGCIIGIALGCLCMVLFHRLESPVVAAAIGRNTPVNAAVATGDVLPVSSSSTKLQLPGATVDVLEQGPFSSAALAKQANVGNSWARYGTVVGSGPYQVWWGTALSLHSAQQQQTTLRGRGIPAKVVSVSWRTTVLSVPFVTTQNQQALLNRWLAAEVSAVRVLTEVVSGDAAHADARQAVGNAEAAANATGLWRDKSLPTSVRELRDDTRNALAKIEKGDMNTAVRDVTNAWLDLNSFKVANASP